MILLPNSVPARAVGEQSIHRADSSKETNQGLPLLILAKGALIFSTVADYTTPLIRRIVLIGKLRLTEQLGASWCKIGHKTDRKIGSRVRYCGESGWTCLAVERLLGRQRLWFCQTVAHHWRIASGGSWPTWPRLDWPRLDWPRLEARLPQGLLPLTNLSQRYQSQLGDSLLRQRFFHS